MFKRFMRSKAVQMTLGFILARYIAFAIFTTRWSIEGQDHIQHMSDNPMPGIVLTWHSRFLMLVAIRKLAPKPPHVLISLSRDGELVAHTARFLGIKTIRGSARKIGSQKSKGGSAALRKMVGVVEDDGVVVMMPDGPKGPRQRLKKNPLGFARMTGAPAVPVTFAVKHRIQFNSWDRFVLPLPFGKGVIIWSAPLTIPVDTSDEELEILRDKIEAEMNANLKDADMRLGKDPVEPEEVSG